MRIGVRILPSESWKIAQRTWRLADQMGFDHAWTYDHVAWRERIGQTWFAAMPTLAAAAGVTERIRLGTLVSSPNFRHPVPFAKEIVTLDDLSSGRFILGLGAGSGGVDAETLGNEPWSIAERFRRFNEFVELTDKLLRTSITDHSGRYYGAKRVCIDPSSQARARVPIAVAATGRKGMKTAARYADIWVTNGYSSKPGVIAPCVDPSLVQYQIGELSRICEEQNRDPISIRKLVHLGQDRSVLESREVFAKTAIQYRDMGVTDLVFPLTHETSSAHADMKVLEQIATDVLPQLSPKNERVPS
ncbi:LLM class flavin-dependent oxidoreductase [Streptomyces sp. 21So2-11]|uniref:LLM class flavin-dependent oxidoreductase n=1 Tax=Streptomyces sp. 21So2-11 TaxID=3144408 RepID=UPI003219CBE6